VSKYQSYLNHDAKTRDAQNFTSDIVDWTFQVNCFELYETALVQRVINF